MKSLTSKISSIDPQADLDRASLPEQERAIRQHCQGKGYQLVEVFSDVGKRWDANRPEFRRMVSWGRENPRPFDLIIVWRADRIVGSASTVAALEPLLDRGGIDIEGVAMNDYSSLDLESQLKLKVNDEIYSLVLSEPGVNIGITKGDELKLKGVLDKEKKVITNISDVWYKLL